MSNITSKGYAGIDEKSPLKVWEFERRPVGDYDVLIDIKFSGICHSDIHTVRGHWGEQPYPQVVGHEIAGIVTAVGDKVTKFKVGDKAGVGCMVGSCMDCENCLNGMEHHCLKTGMLGTYGAPEESSPTGITQGGYALMRAQIKEGDKVGIIGVGGLGHIAIMIAASKGAEVYAFTTSPDKVEDAKSFGAKEVIVVDDLSALEPYRGTLDFMLSTVPYAYELSSYIDCVKPYGYFTQVGQPVGGELTINNFNMIFNRVNFNGSLIGGIPETQEVLDYCAEHSIVPRVQVITPEEINDAWDKVVNKEARYRYVIDTSTLV